MGRPVIVGWLDKGPIDQPTCNSASCGHYSVISGYRGKNSPDPEWIMQGPRGLPDMKNGGQGAPIGAFYHVPHGLSNAMLLPSVTEFSIPAATQRYAECARAMDVAQKEDSDEEANKKLLSELESLNKELNVPSPEEFGINQEEFMDNLEIMAEQALASGSPGNNPRVPDNKEIINIYKLLWS